MTVPSTFWGPWSGFSKLSLAISSLTPQHQLSLLTTWFFNQALAETYWVGHSRATEPKSPVVHAEGATNPWNCLHASDTRVAPLALWGPPWGVSHHYGTCAMTSTVLSLVAHGAVARRRGCQIAMQSTGNLPRSDADRDCVRQVVQKGLTWCACYHAAYRSCSFFPSRASWAASAFRATFPSCAAGRSRLPRAFSLTSLQAMPD